MKRLFFLFFACVVLLGCVRNVNLQQGNELRSEGKNVEALHHYEKALAEIGEYSSEREPLLKEISELRAVITDDILFRGEQTYGAQPTMPSVRKAIEFLERNRAYDDDQRRIEKRISQYFRITEELEAKNITLQNEARKALAKDQYSQAYRMYDAAHAVNPGDEAILKRRNSILPQRNTYYKERMNNAIENDQWREADKLLVAYQSERPAPDPEIYNNLAEKITLLKEMQVAKEAIDLVKEKKFFSAYNLVKTSDIAPLTNLTQTISKEGAEYYLSQIKKYMAGNSARESLIYINAVKGLILDPNNREIFEIHRNYEDKIDDQMRVHIAISGFSSPHNSPGAGVQFSDNLIAYLVNHLPYGIEILERSKIDLMLRESGQELKELSKKLGSKMFIIGNVSILEVEHQKREREATVVVPVGTKQEPNPLYNQMISIYGTSTNNWPSVPPMTITTKITEMVKYNMGSERMKGIMNVSARIFDAEKGAITVAETFKASDEESDQYQDAVPAANIKYDPLELPTDNEMKEKLIDELVSQVAGVVLKAFEQREWRFWARAKARMDRQEKKLALDELAKGYLYCELDGIPEKNQYCQEIRELSLVNLTE